MSTRDHPDWWRPVGGSNSQDSTLERRSMIWNDSQGAPAPAPVIYGSDEACRGKFFTRGCRGMIEEIRIWRTATAGGTITLRFSPHPCIGPLYTVVIPAGLANAWTAVAFEQMWNYDSLFIWVHDLDVGEVWGYDTVTPYDGHESPCCAITEEVPCEAAGCHWDGTNCWPGETWADWDARPFIRVIYSGETPGDVPVSGIVNNVPIPYSSSLMKGEGETIVQNVEEVIVEVEGAGYCDLIRASVAIAPNADDTWYFVYCDGVLAWANQYFMANTFGFTTSTPRVSLTTYTADGRCCFLISKRFEFRRLFQVSALNPNGGAIVSVTIYPTLMR